MQQINLTCSVSILSWIELPDDAQQVIETAKQATFHAYAPYSGFRVGAAVLLGNGVVVTGNNQENAAFPSGLCAERIALFSANALHSHVPVKTIAIAAQREGKFLPNPVSPCGACRQVMLECEKRFENEMDIYLYGTEKIYYLKGIWNLLPLSFDLEGNF